MAVSPGVVQAMLTGLHHTLASGDPRAKQAVLSKMVAKIEMGATGAKLLYAFPLEQHS